MFGDSEQRLRVRPLPGFRYFDNLDHMAVRSTHDAAEGAFRRPKPRQHRQRRPCFLLPRSEPGHRLRPQQGHIGIRDQYLIGLTFQNCCGHLRRVACPQLFWLHHVSRLVAEQLPYTVLPRPDDQHRRQVGHRLRGEKDVLDHWTAADFMQNLLLPGVHPRSLSGGEDDDCEGHISKSFATNSRELSRIKKISC
jgi:hypothetical protein